MTTLSKDYVLKFRDYIGDTDHMVTLPKGESFPDIPTVTALYAQLLQTRYHVAKACSAADVMMPDYYIVTDMDGMVLASGQMPGNAPVEDLAWLCTWLSVFYLTEYDVPKVKLGFKMDDRQHAAIAGTVPGVVIQDHSVGTTGGKPPTLH